MVNLPSGLNNVLDMASDKVEGLLGNPGAAAVGGAIAGASVLGAGIAVASAVKKKRRKAPAKKRSSSSKSSKKRRRSPRYARTAGKRRDTSTRRIRMTKNGQPYVILKSGKARFISKASARASRSRKGGRY